MDDYYYDYDDDLVIEMRLAIEKLSASSFAIAIPTIVEQLTSISIDLLRLLLDLIVALSLSLSILRFIFTLQLMMLCSMAFIDQNDILIFDFDSIHRWLSLIFLYIYINIHKLILFHIFIINSNRSLYSSVNLNFFLFFFNLYFSTLYK